MWSMEPSFLAAILADPADSWPRLVYADWLEENGTDAAALRMAGYLLLEGGPLAGDPVRVYWATYPNCHLLLGTIPEIARPRCRDPRCGQAWRPRAHLWHFGRWRCLQCAAREATRTGLGIWQCVNSLQPIGVEKRPS